MKFKDITIIGLLILSVGMMFLGKETWVSLVGICSSYLLFSAIFIFSTIKWGKNKKVIGEEYIEINRENFIDNISQILIIYLWIKSKYNSRSFILEYEYNKIVEINNFKDFIDSYEGIEKFAIYALIGVMVFWFLGIIKNIICLGRLSKSEILFSNGDIINLSDIKSMQIEDSFWGFSKKIIIYLEKGNRLFYIKNKKFEKAEKYLGNLSISI